MVGNLHRWRAVVSPLENRNSTAGCLLALLFFLLPLLSETFHINVSVIALFAVIYVSIIVPIGTGVISKKYIIRGIRSLSSFFFDDRQWNYYLTQLTYLSSWANYIYLQVDGVQTFTIQATFCIGAEKLFCPTQRLSCLFLIVFYNFLAYLERSLKDRSWVHLFSQRPTSELLKLTAALVFLRLGKGIIVGFALFTINYQFKNLELTFTYIWMTALYFCITQYQNSTTVKNALINWLTRCELQCLEGLENEWVPVLIYSSSIGISLMVFIGLIIYTDNYIVMILMGYFNLSLPLKYFLIPTWKILSSEKGIISKYALATWTNPQIQDGYPCAVCLDKMRVLRARVTPCGHVFHGSCLRKCLQHSKQCPLCKTVL